MSKHEQSSGTRDPESRLFVKRGRYYADFRDYADVNGRKEALRPPGSRHATQDREQALELVTGRIEELKRLRRNGVSAAEARDLTKLGEMIEHHLEQTRLRGDVTDQWMHVIDGHLSRAEEFLGSSTLIRDITTKRLGEYAVYLGTLTDSGRKNGAEGSTLSRGTQRKYLNSLNQLFERAIEAGTLKKGENPLAVLMNKPTSGHVEADWLEVYECALALEAAKLYQPKREDIALPCIYEIVATLALTGGPIEARDRFRLTGHLAAVSRHAFETSKFTQSFAAGLRRYSDIRIAFARCHYQRFGGTLHWRHRAALTLPGP